jgi:hypothetical protein
MHTPIWRTWNTIVVTNWPTQTNFVFLLSKIYKLINNNNIMIIPCLLLNTYSCIFRTKFEGTLTRIIKMETERF